MWLAEFNLYVYSDVKRLNCERAPTNTCVNHNKNTTNHSLCMGPAGPRLPVVFDCGLKLSSIHI